MLRRISATIEGFIVKQVAVLFARSWRHRPIKQLVRHDIAKRSRSRRIHIAHQNVRVVHAANLAKRDVLLVEFLRKSIHRFVASLPDRFIHLHLQHKVAATLQIKPQLDAIGEVVLHLLRGSWKLRQSDQSKNANQNHDRDENELPLELGTHAGWLALLRWFGLQTCDCGARYFNLHLLGNPQLDGIVFEPHDRPVNPPICDHFVASLQITKHFGDLLLPPLRRHDHQKVKNDHYEN